MIGPEPAAPPIGAQEASGPPRRGGDSTADTRVSRAPVHADIVIAGCILVICGLAWAGTTAFEEAPAAITQGMGPAVFPRMIVGVIVLLALWLAWMARGQPDPQRPAVPLAVYHTGIAMLAIMGVLKLLGIYAAILFAAMGIGRLWGERRWWLMAAVGIGLAVATHLVFVIAFKIPLPHPLIGSWLN